MILIGVILLIGGAIGAWKYDEAIGGICFIAALVGAAIVTAHVL